jgi:uncharacterized membrane protein YfcA
VQSLLDISIILIMIGIGAGAVGSMTGVGGGLLMTPALTFMGFTPAQVASTSLIAVTSTSASSTIEYSKQKRIDYAIGSKMAALSIPGAITGALLSNEISIENFKAYFAIILIVTGLYITYKNSIIKEKSAKESKSTSFDLLFYVGSFAAGIVSSLFGIGGGIIFVPLMILVLRMAMLRAGPTSQLTLLISSTAGVLTHSILGHPDYVHGAYLAIGAFVGGQIGARLSYRLEESILQKLLSIILIGTAIKLLFDFMNKK